MTVYAINDWVQRERRGLAHFVESVVAGDVVTRCGRRLSDEPTKSGGGLGPADYDLRRCIGCWRPPEL